jgi:hypothetical protein
LVALRKLCPMVDCAEGYQVHRTVSSFIFNKINKNHIFLKL